MEKAKRDELREIHKRDAYYSTIKKYMLMELLDRADKCDELEERCKVLEEQVKFYSNWCDIFKENSDDHGEDCDHCLFEYRKKCLLVPKG